MKFKYGDKIRHKQITGTTYTVNYVEGITLWVCERNGKKYNGYDIVDKWEKIAPYQMEFDFMKDTNA